MTTQPPPIGDNITDQSGGLTIPWITFFNQSFIGDTGTVWTPTFSGLSSTGTPTITGRYYKLSQEICFVRVTITPATDTSSTEGTTYIDNFPLNVQGDGICASVSNNLGGDLGMIVASNDRIYTPTWTNITTPVTILGMVEAK